MIQSPIGDALPSAPASLYPSGSAKSASFRWPSIQRDAAHIRPVKECAVSTRELSSMVAGIESAANMRVAVPVGEAAARRMQR